MRYFQHPKPIAIEKWSQGEPLIGAGGQPVNQPLTFVHYFENVILDDSRCGRPANARKAVRAHAAVLETSPGEWIALHEEDWQIVKSIAEEPTDPYLPRLLRGVLRAGWIEAIADAKTTPPEKTEAAPAAPNGHGAREKGSDQ